MAEFSKVDGRWHGVKCANCGEKLYSSLPGGTVRWWHIGNTSCLKAEPSPEDVKAMKARSTHGYHLTEQQGKQVQEILNRYVGEELQPMMDSDELDDDGRADVQKDIDYITGLAKLFD